MNGPGLIARTLTNGRDVRHYDTGGRMTLGLICRACEGTGGTTHNGYHFGEPCPSCGGWGWVRLPETPTGRNVTMHEQHRCTECGHRAVILPDGRIEHSDQDDWTLADHAATLHTKETTP